ncbi:hypothetical protein BN871_CE_00040 [Paenibacillus sp. P22]|nr:hypothetical protein BN871_CE_00040 [Paenibacillus sp. P22]
MGLFGKPILDSFPEIKRTDGFKLTHSLVIAIGNFPNVIHVCQQTTYGDGVEFLTTLGTVAVGVQSVSDDL